MPNSQCLILEVRDAELLCMNYAVQIHRTSSIASGDTVEYKAVLKTNDRRNSQS